MPISRNDPLRMFARWPGLFIHIRMIALGCE